MRILSDTEKQQKEELLHAVRTQQKEQVKQFIQNGIDPDTCDNKRNTILMHATEKGWEDIVELLLEKGADPNPQNLEGTTPLKQAISGKAETDVAYQMAKMLIKAKADINVTDHAGCSPLTWAVFYDRDAIAIMLLEHSADPNPLTSIYDRTPLMFAALKGNLEITHLLIKKKVNLNSRTAQGMTALLHAIENGHIELAETLLKAGANPDLIGGVDDNRSPLMAAISGNYLSLTKSLIEDYGVDINIQSDKGWTALTYAIGNDKNTEYIELVLQKNPNVNTGTNIGHTPLMHAVGKNAPQTVAMLLDRNADTNIQNDKGNTALMSAVNLLAAPEIIVRQLLESGADPSYKNDMGQTALDIFMALERDNEKLVSLLTKGYAQILAEEKQSKKQRQNTQRRQFRNYLRPKP